MAPEVKTVPETMTAAFEDFMGAFEAFKEVNDRRLGEIETKLSADVVTRDKMERIGTRDDRLQRDGDRCVELPQVGRPDRRHADAQRDARQAGALATVIQAGGIFSNFGRSGSRWSQGWEDAFQVAICGL